jgi:hypothetical protein
MSPVIADRIEGFLGLAFLKEPEQRVDDNNTEDKSGIKPQTDHHLDETGAEQNIDESIVKLEQKPHQLSLLLPLRQTIRTVLQPHDNSLCPGYLITVP